MERLATGYTLIEGPAWDPARGLLFSDVHEGGVFCLSRSGSVTPVIEHRRGIGGIALHERGGLVVGGRNIAYKGPAAAGTVVLLDSERAGGGAGFNDLTTDEAGRIYVGSLGMSPFDAGAEAEDRIPPRHRSRRLEPDPRARHPAHQRPRLLARRQAALPLRFAREHRRRLRRARRRQRERAPRVRARRARRPRRARGGGGRLGVGGRRRAAARCECSTPTASERRPIAVPQPGVTSLCFGGDDRRDLYVVTGTVGGPSDHTGSVYRVRVDVPGLPVPLARVALSQTVS